MNRQRACTLLTGFLLFAGLSGCADAPVPKERKPTPIASKLGPAASSPADDTSLRKLVRDQAEKCSTAFIEGDYETFTDLTHRELVRKAGGRDEMIAQLRANAEELSKRFKVLAVEVGVPEEIAEAGADLVAIVPTVTRMDLPGISEQTHRSFLIGVSDDKGRTWTFLEGSGYDEKSIRKVLPDFPETLELPKIEMPNAQDVQRTVAERTKQVMTVSQLKLLQTVLRMYQLHMGSYPTTAQGLQALRNPPADMPNPVKWKGPYLRSPLPLDPWGNPFQYECGDGGKPPRIWSFGPDGLAETADDVIADWSSKET